MRVLVSAVVGGIVAVCAASHAGAQAPTAPEPIELRYVAPEGCPDETAFFASLRARANASLTTVAKRTFEVRIEMDVPGSARGSLVVREDTATTTREVAGASCADVASALALVAALAIEQRHAVERSPARPPRGRRVAVGSGILLMDRITPEMLVGIPLFAIVEPGHSVRLRAGFLRTLEQDIAMSSGTSAYRATIGRVEGCPHVFSLAWFEVTPCVGIDAGVLDARGVGGAMPAAELRPWVAAEAVLRIGIRLRRVEVEVEAGIAAPLVRDRFYLAPDTTIYRVPAVTTVVGTSLVLHVF